MSKRINALTYNMSWATQLNKAAGTEKDFVERCQKKYKNGGLNCTNNAIKNIGTLDTLDLMGIQEVSSDLEPRIQRVQKNLEEFVRFKRGTSIVSIMWNPDVFGNIVAKTGIDMAIKSGDNRPALAILLKKKDGSEYIIINLHAPNPLDKAKLQDDIDKLISKNKKIKVALKNPNTKLIILGDFNDKYTEIHKNNPLKITSNKSKKLMMGMPSSKGELKKNLKSCCWHKPGYKKHFERPGDYILVGKNSKIIKLEIPKIFNKPGRNNRLFSDHAPVLAEIKFT
jgi:endonuclease/exonuclease/phosphatase family metal-dependent hydrolase